jgi:isocitrate/isopropylmalate dehydrogenase
MTDSLSAQTITGDLGGKSKTHEYAAAVIKNL